MRDLFFKDFGWKLFSLLLAAFIWFTVDKLIEEPQPQTIEAPDALIEQTYKDLPILIVATAADMHLYRVKPDTVAVTVSGPPRAMHDLHGSQIRVTVDLSGTGTPVVMPVSVAIPSGFTFISVNPSSVSVVVPK